VNCRPGDLAVIVRSDTCPENIGRFVTVTGPADDWAIECDWLIECATALKRCHNGVFSYGHKTNIADNRLRPVRGPDGVDETLRQKELAAD
jgi:hypothetical protein